MHYKGILKTHVLCFVIRMLKKINTNGWSQIFIKFSNKLKRLYKISKLKWYLTWETMLLEKSHKIYMFLKHVWEQINNRKKSGTFHPILLVFVFYLCTYTFLFSFQNIYVNCPNLSKTLNKFVYCKIFQHNSNCCNLFHLENMKLPVFIFSRIVFFFDWIQMLWMCSESKLSDLQLGLLKIRKVCLVPCR